MYLPLTADRGQLLITNAPGAGPEGVIMTGDDDPSLALQWYKMVSPGKGQAVGECHGVGQRSLEQLLLAPITLTSNLMIGVAVAKKDHSFFVFT